MANSNKENQGATCSPLLGDTGQPGFQQETSTDPGPGAEERGRPWGREAAKRTKKVLERWPPDPGTSPRGPLQRKPIKRLKGTTPGKDKAEGKGHRGMQDFLWTWIGKAKEEGDRTTCQSPRNSLE